MRVLLDTHALVWWWTDDQRLPPAARAVIADPTNTIMVSSVCAWEIATKYRVGKWPEVAPVLQGFQTFVLRSRFMPMSVTMAHALAAGSLAGPHRDPFDRMLVAQAQDEGIPIITADRVFRHYGASVIWDAGQNDSKA